MECWPRTEEEDNSTVKLVLVLTYCMSQKTFDVQHTTIAKVGKVLYLTYLTYLIPNSYLIFTLRWGKVKILTYFTYFTYT